MHPTPLSWYPQFVPFVEAEWRAHFADDFAELARTPSEGIAAWCAALRADRALFTSDALLAHASGTDDDATRARYHDAWRRAREGNPGGGPWFMRKALLAEGMRQAPDPAVRAQCATALEKLAGIDTPKAAQVRAAMKPVVQRLFGGPLASSGGGDSSVPFEAGGTAMQLVVDTGGMARGFRYFIRPSQRPGFPMLLGIAYETLLGLPGFPWDMLRTDRLDAQIGLWAERLERLVSVLRATGSGESRT